MLILVKMLVLMLMVKLMLVLMMSKFMQTLVMQIKIYKILKQKIEDLRFFLSLFFQPYALYYSQVIQKPKNQQIYYTLSQ